MLFKDQFKNHILPEQVHILNVSFLVPELRREFGGCAGNIAYNLKLLGGDPLPMGTVGGDFAPYAAWMDQWKIPRTHLKTIDSAYTAQAFITTDLDDNQITAFHPGAMSFAHENMVSDASGVKLGIVSPDGRDGMIQHAEQFKAAGIPFIFDPGQGMPMFDGEDLKQFIAQATWVTVNDYEWQLMHDRTGLSTEEVVAQVEALIVTKAAEGAVIYTRDKTYEIPAAKATQVADPTGCGDAFRAGLLYGLTHELDWETTGRIASLMGAIKIASSGTQNHAPSLEAIKALYQQNFGGTF
jgi:adenosine kinase